jgi:RNase H-fold protein (predicted Holliday junction resolvase)
VVIGLAQTLSGQETKVTTQARRLGDRLTTLGVEVVFENEQLTTFTAKRSQLGVPKVRFDDHLAASLILQQYLSRDV